MKQTAILVVTSLLSSLLLTLQITDDIVRGISKAEPSNTAPAHPRVFLFGRSCSPNGDRGKDQWLFLQSLDSITTVRRLVAFYVDDHNRVLPYSRFAARRLTRCASEHETRCLYTGHHARPPRAGLALKQTRRRRARRARQSMRSRDHRGRHGPGARRRRRTGPHVARGDDQNRVRHQGRPFHRMRSVQQLLAERVRDVAEVRWTQDEKGSPTSMLIEHHHHHRPEICPYQGAVGHTQPTAAKAKPRPSRLIDDVLKRDHLRGNRLVAALRGSLACPVHERASARQASELSRRRMSRR
jgi:hypothetical protein